MIDKRSEIDLERLVKSESIVLVLEYRHLAPFGVRIIGRRFWRCGGAWTLNGERFQRVCIGLSIDRFQFDQIS